MRSYFRKFLRFVGVVEICILVFANAHAYLRIRFFHLLESAWLLFLQKEGTTSPGFASTIAWPIISIAIAWYLIRKERGKGAADMHLKQEASLAARVVITVAILIYGPMAIWCAVRAVYDDHHNMSSRWQAVVRERETLKSEIERRDSYIKSLESVRCSTCPKTGATRASITPPPVETIYEVVADVRVTCILKDPSKMPEDLKLLIPSEDSYLEGGGGKAYLLSRAARYQRAEEDGKAVAIEIFRAPPNSDLIGRPVSSLSDYSVFHLVDTSVSEGKFSECTYVEVALRANGRDVFRHAEEIHEKLDPTHGITGNMKLIGMRLQK